MNQQERSYRDCPECAFLIAEEARAKCAWQAAKDNRTFHTKHQHVKQAEKRTRIRSPRGRKSKYLRTSQTWLPFPEYLLCAPRSI
jgi:hypothetical protein